jgi:small subunit ribosomal protein S9
VQDQTPVADATPTTPAAPTAPPATASEQPLSEEDLRAAFAAQQAAASQPEEPPAPVDDGPLGRPATGRGLGTGRRKEAVVRVRLVPGEGRFTLNGRSLEDYFPARAHRMTVTAPLRLSGRDHDFDVIARLHGGGISGQAGALSLGISRALIDLDATLRPALKAEGMLSRDAREKERRKYGLKKARKAPQYSKR